MEARLAAGACRRHSLSRLVSRNTVVLFCFPKQSPGSQLVFRGGQALGLHRTPRRLAATVLERNEPEMASAFDRARIIYCLAAGAGGDATWFVAWELDGKGAKMKAETQASRPGL